MNDIKLNTKKLKIKKIIEKNELKKANLILTLGQLVYQKIREKSIVDSNFDSICEEIEAIDKLIYINSLELNIMDEKRIDEICVCGQRCNIDSSYCSACGEKLKKVVLEKSICVYCDVEIDIDSKFCICCGKKVDFINKQCTLDDEIIKFETNDEKEKYIK